MSASRIACRFVSTADRHSGTALRYLAESWSIKCFWKPRPLEGARDGLVLEQWDALRGIQELLRGDSKLGGNVDDLKIRQYPRIEPETYGEADFDVLTIEFDTWNLNAEAISA